MCESLFTELRHTGSRKHPNINILGTDRYVIYATRHRDRIPTYLTPSVTLNELESQLAHWTYIVCVLYQYTRILTI